MSERPPLTVEDIVALRGDVRFLAESVDTLAAKIDDEADQRRRTIKMLVAGGVIVAVFVVGLVFGFRAYDSNRISDNARMCAVFAKAHNGLVGQDEDTIRFVLGRSMNPEIVQLLNDRVAAYETNRVDPADCAPT